MTETTATKIKLAATTIIAPLGSHCDISVFPEIIQYKPAVFYDYGGNTSQNNAQFWFPLEDRESRINILKSAIEQTKP